MDNKYRELFLLITQSVSNTAERVMDLYNNDKEKEKEYQSAEIMRNDYLELYDKLKENADLVKADYARLLVGTIIVTNQLEAKIKNDQQALQGYKIELIPKLDQIVNAENEETIPQLAEDLFKIETKVKNED